MIVNPEKFQAIAVKKNTKMKDSYPLNVNDRTVNSENSVKSLEIEIDNKLFFEQHSSTLCNKASKQLNAIEKYKNSWVLRKKKFFLIVLYTQTFIILLFGSYKSLYKIEKIQERALRLLHNDFASDCAELPKKSGKGTMEIKRLRYLALEIFKTVNNLNPCYMMDIFSETTYLTHKPWT